MAKHTAREVAEYFLASVDPDTGDNLTNMKLQKLVYYAQGFHLALFDGEPLFDDPIEAWEHGPVVPTLYRKYESHEAGAVPPSESFDESRYDDETRGLLDEVWEVYGQFAAWKLRDMTREEPPWRETPTNGVISTRAMQDYFQTLLIKN